MRILLVNKFARVTGGADRHVLELIALLSARGHEVRLLSTRSEGNHPCEGMFVRCRVTHSTRSALRRHEKAAVVRDALWNREAAAATKTLIAKFAPEVVHTHKLYPQLSVAPVVVASQAGIPIVQTLHDYEFLAANPFDSDGSWRDRTEQRWSYRTLNTITRPLRTRVHLPRLSSMIAVSAFVADRHAPLRVPVTTIENFVLRPAERPRPFGEREGIAFAGRLTAEKGIADLIHVAGELEQRVLIAGGGPLAESVEAAARRNPRLVYVGVKRGDEIRRLFGSARVVIVPSKWNEPGPLVALEAFAEATPVVCYSVGGLAEYVRQGDAGVVANGDVAELSAAAWGLAENEQMWSHVSRNALTAARERHNPDRYIDQLEEVYERVSHANARRV